MIHPGSNYRTSPQPAQEDGEQRPGSDYVAYLQEKAEPANLEDIPQKVWDEFYEQIENAGLLFRDPDSPGQLGFNRDGKLVVIDWFSFVHPRWVRVGEHNGQW